MSNVDNILCYFDELIKNPRCELEYKKPYELVIAVMLSAQATDKRVNLVTKELFGTYKTLEDLKEADIKDVERIVRPLGNYTKKSKAIIDIAKILVDKHNKIVPRKREYLETFPMIGRKSASVILSEIYDIPNIAVDTHVERVSKRLYLAKDSDNVLQVEQKLKRKIPKERWNRFHHQAVLFGRYYCKAVKPNCNDCKLINDCKRGRNANRNK